MIIPEDGCLPPITRKGFAAFNNVMIVKVPDKLKQPGEMSFQLATLDRSKKGERWPADKYVDTIMSTPISKETESAEKSKEDNIPNTQMSNFRNKGTFLPKKFQSFPKNFIGFSKKNLSQEESQEPIPSERANLNHHFFNDNTHTYRYHPNKFSNEHQPYDGLGDSLLGEGPLLSNHESRYAAQGKTANATVTREPLIKNLPYNNDFHLQENQHDLVISPSKSPFNDFRRNPPPFLPPFVNGPQENNFNRTEVPLIGNAPMVYNANNYPAFPYNHPNRTEFINTNFSLPPHHNDLLEPGLNNGFNNPRNDLPPPFPPPYYNQHGNFRNNFDEGNPYYDHHNQQTGHYNRNPGNERRYRSRRGRGDNKFSKGNNNNRRRNNKFWQRKKSS